MLRHRTLLPAFLATVAVVLSGIGLAAPASAAPKPRMPITLTSDLSGSTTGSTSVTFSWSSPAVGASYTCTLDGVAVTGCTSPRAYSGLAQGSHTFVVTGKLNSQYRPGSATRTWTVDTTPPGAPTVVDVQSPTSSTSALVYFSNNDPTAVAHTCALDGGAPVLCTSPWSTGTLGEGDHTVVVRSRDFQGVLGGTDSTTWTVDLTAPANVLVTAPTSPSTSAEADITFSAAGATSFACSLDGGPADPCTSPWHLAGLSDGQHSVTVSASDGVGNAAQPGSAVWTVDTTAPAAPTVLTGPADPTNQTTADVVLEVADPSDSFQCRLDTATWSPCPTPLHWSGLAAGSHVLDLRAVDESGNAGAATTLTWVVDLTAPAPAQFLSGPAAFSNLRLPDFDFVSTDPTATGFKCKLDNGLWVTCDIDTVPLPAAPGLAEGAHVLSVVSVDASNNLSSPVSWSWPVDLTAPGAPAFVSKPDASTSDTSARFEFDAESGAQVMCSVDGGANGQCASPFLLSGLAQGDHTLAVTQTDAAGNTGPTATHAWTVDTTAPAAPVVLTGPADPTNQTTADVVLDVADPSDTLECRLDATTWSACPTPLHWSGLTEGTHSLHLRAVDEAGNAGAATTLTWDVDLTAPAPAQFVSGPAASSNVRLPDFAFVSTDPTATGFKCQLDGGGWVACTVDTVPLPAAPGLDEGAHVLSVVSVDSADNVSSSVSWTWQVDLTAPAAPTVLTGPADPTNQTTADVALDVGDPSDTLQCRLDATTWSPCPTPLHWAGLTEGTHSLDLRAVDEAGNAGAATTLTWDVDLTAPAPAQFLDGPAASSNVRLPDFDFGSTDPTHAGFKCQLDGGSWVTCDVDSVPLPAAPGLDEGSHVLSVVSVDASSNVSSPVSWTWQVDLTAPAAPTVLTGPANPTNQTTADVALDVADPSDTLQCRLDTTTWSACPAPLQWGSLTAGPHTLDLRAMDEAGNAGAATTLTWDVDLTAPDPAQFLSGPDASSNVRLPDFDFVHTDPTATGFKCRLDGGGWATCTTDTVPLPAAPGLDEGSHVLSVVSVDSADNDSSPVSWTWDVDLTAPAAPDFTVKPASSTTDTSARFEFDVEAGAQATCSVDGAPSEPCASPFLLPGLALGDHTLAVSQRDAAGNTGATTTYSWTVKAPVPPVVTPPTPAPTPVAAPTTVSLTASRALKGRSTATFSAAVTAVTGGLSSGSSTVPVTVVCTDAAGSAVSCQSGAVRGATVQPAVRLVPGQTYLLQVSGTDAAGRPATASATFRASTAEQESSLAAGYRWGVVKTAKAYGRSYLSAAAKGSAVSTTFRGTSVTWYTMTGPGQGRATVYVDGVAKGRVNNWSAATRWHVPRTVKGLKAGTHTLKVVVAGRKGASSGTGTGVAFDAVKVGKKLTAGPRTTATWSRVASAKASGRSYAASAVKGSTAAFTFRGTSVTWLTARGPAMGKAKVYVDGVLKLTVDGYAKKAGWNVRRSLTGLTDGVHTVTVKVTGKKRRASTGTTVVVDRWLVG